MNERIWVLDDDRSIRWVLENALKPEGYQVQCFGDADSALNHLEDGGAPPDVVLTDIRMPGTNGLRALKWLHQRLPDLPVIVMTAHSDLDAAVASYREGAFDYVPKPFDLEEIKSLVHSAASRAKEAHAARSEDTVTVPEIIGKSPAMQEVFRAIGRLGQSSVTVLISGASGTGKERVAKALHRHSVRADAAFVAINMAAIPRELIESELFGHERGAFTGANSLHVGRFEQANGGTLFLDEIGDMPLDAQTRLLRVLQENEIHRVGSTKAIKVNVRIIAATHRDLEARVADKSFRQDLFYRLNVIRIHLPDLTQRREDIAQLADHFLAEAAREMGVEAKFLLPQTQARLERLPWPGNVRQLENLCRWLTVMVSGNEIYPGDLPPELHAGDPALAAPDQAHDAHGQWQKQLAQWAEAQLAQGVEGLVDVALPIFEQTLLEVALRKTGGHRQHAARLLGWGRNTLTRKLKD